MSILNQISKPFLLPPKTSSKKTLVLDLDETLVHSQFLPNSIPSDLILKIDIYNQLQDIHVLIRPGVQNFLKKLGKLYEIVIFTASISKYASPLLDIIDKDNICSFRLFREHCSMMGVTYIKDLNNLGRDLKDVIIVDNSPLSYSLNKENGIPISTWFNDKKDKELYNILPILEFLSCVNDVRDYIKNIVINDNISYENTINIIENFSRLNKNINCESYINEIINIINRKKNENDKKNIETTNKFINDIKSKEGQNGYINITIANNEINNYLYFSPIYTINNNNIKSQNSNNELLDNLNIKINNEYDKTVNKNNNPSEKSNKKVEINSKTNRPKSKDIFNKVRLRGKNHLQNKEKIIKQKKIILKNTIKKSIKFGDLIDKSINYALYLNNNNSKDYINDQNSLDLKTLISSKKNYPTKNFQLPKTLEIKQILYNTNTTKKTIDDLNRNIILNQTGLSNNKDINKNYNQRNTKNKLKKKIDLNVNHEKHKSFNLTELNFGCGFRTSKNSNSNRNNLFYETKSNIIVRDSSLSKNKLLNKIRNNKTIYDDNIKIKYSFNNFHKKNLSNQFKTIRVTEFDKTNKIKKIIKYKFQNQNSSSKNNNKLRKINNINNININRTTNDNNKYNNSLKKFFNINRNISKISLHKTNQKKFNQKLTNKIRKFTTNLKNISDYSQTLRHKKTLSFNGEIFPFKIINKTNLASLSKKIIREKSNKFTDINNNINKNILKAIRISLNTEKRKKDHKIRKIKGIKYISILDDSNINNHRTDIIDNIF